MENVEQTQFKVGIIGGGVAGSTIAIRLAALGITTYLFETKSSLIDGPPMCHLHAGGNLYREIPDADCIVLLKQSIDMLRMYPYSIDVRPTVIAIPKRDEGKPDDLLPRLQLLTNEYRKLIHLDPENKVLGEPDDYFHLYQREDLEKLMTSHSDNLSYLQQDTDQWVLQAAKQLDLNKLKFPIVVVKEYGWNIFRLAASAQTALGCYPNAHLFLNTQVLNVSEIDCDTATLPIELATNTHHLYQAVNQSKKQWQIEFTNLKSRLQTNSEQPAVQKIQVDYLINACGFRTGVIDNMVGIPAQRMVEFKASYVTHWERQQPASHINKALSSATSASDKRFSKQPNYLPEIIIHGKRGTPQGMVQLTPYPDGYYQIHSMNNTVTLFDDGLVATTDNDAQPKLKSTYLDFIDDGWNPTTLQQRSEKAIEQVSEFVPQFASAKPTGKALYGGQQIPGRNDSLRVADVSIYPDRHYARAENVKASSALEASDDIVAEFEKQNLIMTQQDNDRHHHNWAYLRTTDKLYIDAVSQALALQRNFPSSMSGVVTPYS